MLGLLFAITLPASAGLLPTEPPPAALPCGQTEGTVCVPVAARDLAVGTILSAEDLRMIDLPEAVLASWTHRSVETLVGRALRERILIDEPIREERLLDMPVGCSFVTLTVREASLEIVAPGNYVDMIVTSDRTGRLETTTILQGVEVLEIDRARAMVTLRATIDQRFALRNVDEQDSVTLALRRDADITHIETNGALGAPSKGASAVRE